MAKSTFGTELMRKIAEGQIEHLPSEFIAQTRTEISTAIEELIDVGARVRPLMVGNERIGWVRGVHLTERKLLQRWALGETEFILTMLGLATTLTPDELRSLNLIEVRSLSRLVREMTDSDLRLYPYLQSFVSTSMSEQLWYSKGTDATTFRDRTIRMPDGKELKILAPPDQSRLWATLCNYRIQTKQRLDASFNTVLTIRPWVGRGADPLSADLKNIARSLRTDSFEPWREVIRAEPEVRFNDGWAHSEDDSIEGMKRELKGMLSMDRHEQVVAAFEKQTREREEQKLRQQEALVKHRRELLAEAPPMVPMTEAEVQSQTAAHRQRSQVTPVVAEETQSSLIDRLAKYK